MKRCVICAAPVKGRYDYCRKCFGSKIHELELMYGEKEEGPSAQSGRKEGEAQASELFAQHTGRR